MFKCFNELGIVAHSLIISLILGFHLLEEEFLLDEGIV